MHTMCPGCRHTRKLRSKRGQLIGVEGFELGTRPCGAVRDGIHVNSDFKSLGNVGGGLGIGKGVTRQRLREQIRRLPYALPVRYRAPGCAGGEEIGETVYGVARAIVGPMVVASHHDDCLETTWEIPETWQRLARTVHLQDQVGQK